MNHHTARIVAYTIEALLFAFSAAAALKIFFAAKKSDKKSNAVAATIPAAIEGSPFLSAKIEELRPKVLDKWAAANKYSRIENKSATEIFAYYNPSNHFMPISIALMQRNGNLAIWAYLIVNDRVIPANKFGSLNLRVRKIRRDFQQLVSELNPN